jgi:acetate kinase
MQRSSEALVVNAGSSSVRFAVFAVDGNEPKRMLGGRIELRECGSVGGLVDWIAEQTREHTIAALGHRLVHGGPKLLAPCRVTPAVVAELRSLVLLDPAHLPLELDLLDTFTERWPELPQFASFDTAFHRSLPRAAQLLPLPRRLFDQGIRRYGFHGLSYAYVLEELCRRSGSATPPERVILAHLGNGASLAAVKDGVCIDTTMAMTPTSGVPMGTRSGDIDAGLVAVLLRTEHLDADGFERLVTRESGLFGISETSSDIRELLEMRPTDERAADAVAVFCHHVKKVIGGFVAVLGGVDVLAFSGGIGENAPVIRSEICAGLDVFGIALDRDANARNGAVISSVQSRVGVHVVRTDEEATIAGEMFALMKEEPR